LLPIFIVIFGVNVGYTATFILVFHFRYHAKRLAEILLLKALPMG
jgi:hypothetical protein